MKKFKEKINKIFSAINVWINGIIGKVYAARFNAIDTFYGVKYDPIEEKQTIKSMSGINEASLTIKIISVLFVLMLGFYIFLKKMNKKLKIIILVVLGLILGILIYLFK